MGREGWADGGGVDGGQEEFSIRQGTWKIIPGAEKLG